MQKENKKIKGAKPTVYDGIHFKSLQECRCYTLLKEAGFDFAYESEKIILWQGFRPLHTSIFIPKKLGPGKWEQTLSMQTRFLSNITYTPDFVINKKYYKIYIDVKGKENDIYPIKRKMFIKYLEQKSEDKDNRLRYMFFEPHNIRQIIQVIEIIKNL